MSNLVLGTIIIAACFVMATCQQSEAKLSPSNKQVLTEGGSITINKTHVSQVSQGHMIAVNITKLNNTDPPQFEVPEKNDDKKSVGRKGVTIAVSGADKSTISTTSTTSTSTTTTTTTTEKPKKPTITEADDDSTHLSVNANVTKNKNPENSNMIDERKRKTDYVVPIVVVILSVPLVAIIFSVLYKRGAEWWQHRHYRRMDFLIEGMYNN